MLDQVWLVDALKMIITAEQFALRIPKLAEKWKDFQSGVIERSTIGMFSYMFLNKNCMWQDMSSWRSFLLPVV